MKKILLAIILVLPTLLFSQILDPVEWEFFKEDLGGGEYELFSKQILKMDGICILNLLKMMAPCRLLSLSFNQIAMNLLVPHKRVSPNKNMILILIWSCLIFLKKLYSVKK